MASLLVGDSFDIVAALCKRYVLFCEDINYYEDVVSSFGKMSPDKLLQKADSKILTDIRGSIKTNNDWFLNFVHEQLNSKKAVIKSLNTIANLCIKWYIEIDIDTLSILTDKSQEFDEALKEALSRVRPITMTSIERVTSNKLLIDILIGYATIKNLLEEEKEEEASDDSVEENENDKSYYFNDDIIKIYMREMGQYPLLTPEEEREIAFLAEAGDEKAKQKLASHNLRLVLNIAKRFLGRGLDFSDLIQAGNEGLLKAVDRYKPQKGFKFSTYATWWIRQAIDRAIKDEGRTIRIPVHLQDTYYKIVKTRENLAKTYGEPVKWEDVASELGMDADDVIEIVLNFKDNISMSSPVGEEEDSEYGDFLSNPDEDTPEDAVIKEGLKDALAGVLSTLSQREEQIIRLRFGVQDSNNPNPEYSKEHTLEEVGAMFHVTRERIRQIEAKALGKLRHPTRSRKLDSYYSRPASKPQSAASVDSGIKNASKKKKACVSSKPKQGSNLKNSPVRIIKPGDPDWTPPSKPREKVALPPYDYKNNYKAPVPSLMEEEDMGERKNYKELKFLYELIECTKEELEFIKPYIISQRELATYGMLFTIYGENLEDKGSLENIDYSLKKDFYNAVTVLKSRISRLRTLGYKSLQEVLEMNDNEYQEALNYLKSQDGVDILIKVHGKNLGKYANVAILNRKEEKTYDRLISAAKKFIQSLNSRQTLQEIIGCPDDLWENVKTLIVRNENLKSLFSPVFGDLFSLKENLDGINSKDRKIYNRAIENLRSLVVGALKYRGKTLASILNLTTENKESTLNGLKDSEVLTAVFGPNLQDSFNISSYFNIGDKEFERVINKAKNYKPKNNRGITLQKTLGLSDDDLDVITALNASLENARNLNYKTQLRAAYGDDLLQGKLSEIDTYNIVMKLKPRVKTVLELKNKTLYETFELSPSQIVRVRGKMLKAKFYSSASELYGKDLSKSINLISYFSMDGRGYYGFSVGANNIVQEVKSFADELDTLIDDYEGKKLEEIIGCSVEELPDLMAQAADDEMLSDFALVHGINNDKVFSALNPNITLKFFKKYQDGINKLKTLYNTVDIPDGGEDPSSLTKRATSGNEKVELSSYTHPLFREAIKVVPVNYRYILMLHLGLQDDGICYPVETLMTIFNRSKEEIEDALLRGKIFFDEIVAAYEKVYTSSFPLQQLPEDITRKRFVHNL